MPRKGSPPVIIGHRGHSDSYENSLVAFREAIDLGAEMLELDTRLGREPVPIVFHDRTLKRMAGRSGSVAKMSMASLKRVEFSPGVGIPSLGEVLEELTPRVPINIELKYYNYNYRDLMTAVIEVIKELGVERRVLVSSFFHYPLHFIARELPEVEIAPLFGLLSGPPHREDLKLVFERPLRKPEETGLPFAGRAAVVDCKLIDERLAGEFEQAEATLLTYTVDEPEEMRRLIDLGIDGIITNQPGRLAGVLKTVFS